MHDIRAIRSDPGGFDAALARRGLSASSPEILKLDTERRAVQTALQEKQARRNAISREVGQGKRSGADTSALEAEATALRNDMDGQEKQAAALDDAIRRILENLPNILDPDVPDGPDEAAISSSARRWA
jgi:seryl-tRNA synthetase